MRNSKRKLLCFGLFASITTAAWGQGIFATLTGLVSDPSESVVPKAKITLRNVLSGSIRETVTNGEGYYTFASVPVGAYALTVEAQGFKTHREDEIRLGGGERRNVNVSLAVGDARETIEITGVQDFTVATVDSGNKSFTLETKELQNFIQVGSNAAEYLKIVPGFGIRNGTKNAASYSGQVIGINANGDAGSQSPLNSAFSYNGLPDNSLDIVADGGHVSDPGCNCDTPVNPNSDFVQEFKVLTSNYSAEYQKGPIVITTVTKAGGNAFHGSAFFSARNHALNANDWLNNYSGVKQPANAYYYPGFTFSGPVLIPGTSFNKSRKKLFFFTGFEYFYQTLDSGLLRATVPTAGEINGNFSPAEVAKEGTITASGGPPGQLTPAAVAAFGGYQIPSSAFDPNMQALMKLYPAPNADPNSTGGFNYVRTPIFNQNNRQLTTRVDYNISENTKVFVRYNSQRETQQFPVGLWWRNTDQVPYPTPILGKNKSDSWAGTITHVFSPTMTNEIVVAYTFIGFPNVFKDPKKVDRTTVGYGYAGLFNNGVAQIPSFGNFGSSEAALMFNPGGFEAGGPWQGLYANKYLPSISDTATKVWRTHTFKVGFFYEWIRNTQPANNSTNSQMLFSKSSQFSYGNEYADMLTGNITAGYTETNFNRLNDISYHTVEGFIQDSWKVRKRFTLELGLRLTHFTPWVDDEGFGYPIFDLSQYDPSCASAAGGFCGFVWHAKNHAIPLGGFPSRTVFYAPRFGMAYDLFGTGKTVLRGGWGRAYFHPGQFTNGLDTSAGVHTANLDTSNWVGGPGCPTNSGGAPLFAKNMSCIQVSAALAAPAAVDSKDDRPPHTDSYSFTIAQRLPWQSLVEVSYVGNQSEDLANDSGFGSNINLVPIGAMLSDPDPYNANPDKYRPLNTVDSNGNALGYSDLSLATNKLYANYNSLQITWGRHAGRHTLQANYSLQKALGVISPDLNPFNLHANYGVQPTDRRHLFNVAYSIELGNPVHDNRFLGGLVNSWQISGITQVQSGVNLIANTSFNIDSSVTRSDGSGISVGNQSILGTNAIQLNPLLTCNPTSGLGDHQFINPKCFAVPTVVGQNGPTVLPAVYGPHYFDSDLGLFKNFHISESMRLQFRAQAYNFLNHPLWSFPDTSNLTLYFTQDSNGVVSQVNKNFGTAAVKNGNRVVEVAVKFFF